jgi:ankyrin repeat protein
MGLYENGQTALIWACGEGHETVVEHLIRSGAYVNATDEKYQTAYNYAVDSGHSSLANRLIALQERTEYIDIDISNQLSERWF